MGMKTGGTGKFAKFFAIGASVVAAGAIAAMVVVMMKGSNNKIVSYSATFVANTDPNHNGKIQGSSEKTFTNVNKLDAGYAPDTLDNYQFDYWCTDEALSKQATFPVTLTQNAKYYAKWSKPQTGVYRVTFETDGGTPVGETSVTIGESISRPETSKTNYELVNWHENSISGPVVFKKVGSEYERYTPTKNNVKLYAEWKQVAFNVGLSLDDGTAKYVKDTVKIGGVDYPGFPMTKKIETAPYAEKKDYVLGGWYSNSSCELKDLVTFPFEPKGETILYAKWNPVTTTTLTVIAGKDDSDYGFLPKVGKETADPHWREIKTDFVAYAPTAYYDKEYRDKYKLLGWFTEEEGGELVEFPIKLDSNKTIYAHWEQVRFKATIYANEHEGTVTERKLNEWDNLALVRYADIPTPEATDIDFTGKSGSAADYKAYTLKNWEVYDAKTGEEYKGEGKTEAGNLDINPLKANVRINAKWKHSKFNVTLHNGASTEVLQYQTNETLGTSGPACPEAWIPDHHVFTGWYSDAECKNKIDFTKYELTGDADFYTQPTLAMGKVYLHTSYDKESSTYNGTNDYYYTADYSLLGAGFAARDLPTVEHYKALGWTFTSTDEDKTKWVEPSTSGTIYNKDVKEEKDKIKPWPSDGVRPEAGKIAHLYPTYEQSQYEISFVVGAEATACNSIWTKDKDDSGNAFIGNQTIPESTKTFCVFKGWSSTEGGKPYTTEELKAHPFTEDTKLYACWDVIQHTVNFNVIETDGTFENYKLGFSQKGLTQLTSGALSDIIKNLNNDQKLRNNAKIAGFVTKENKPTTDKGTFDTTKMITKLDSITEDIDLYAVYYHTDYEITIKLNGAKVDGSENDIKIDGSNEPVTDKTTWYSKIAEKGTITPPTDLPSFYGFADESGNIIEYPYTLTGNTTLKMIWVNNQKFMVTFDAGNGDFYYVQNGVTRTTPIISYEVNLDSSLWKGKSPTLDNVFEEARKERQCLKENFIVNDGYSFEAWQYSSVDIDGSYVINTSRGFTARWEADTPSNWWDDSTGLIIALAEQEPASGETAALQTAYKEQYEGTKATKDAAEGTKKDNTFVGLEKEITIPTLSTKNKFTTRVIGEWQDKTSDDKSVYLTIQFIDAPISGCYASDSNKDPRYEYSIIRTSTMPYLLGAIPSSLTNHFKSVTKPYLTGTTTTSTSCTTMTSSEESLFILSAYELGGSTTGSAQNEYNNRGDYNVFTYKYYENLGDGTSAGAAITERAFTYPYTDSTIYTNAWTRTPVGTYLPKSGGTDQAVYFIGHDTGNINLGAFCCWDPMSGYGICPAFCIGYTTKA